MRPPSQALAARLTLAVLPLASGGQAPRAVELRPLAMAVEPFSRIRGIAELPDGRLLVADQIESGVYLIGFGGPGKVQLGANGRGPREYRLPLGLFPGAADTVLAYDLLNRRFAIVTPGGVAGTVPIDRLSPPGTIPRFADRERRLYWDEVSAARRIKAARPGARAGDVAPLLRATGMRVDTLGRLRIPGPANPGPVPEWDRWAVGGDGWVAIVRNQDEYRVDWIDPDGRVTAGPAVDDSRIGIGRRDRDELESSAGAGVSLGGRGGAGRGRTRAHVPERFPFALDIAVSPQREAWVLRALPLEDTRPLFDVFDATGRRLARYRLPEGRRLLGFGERALYAAREDGAGLLWVERYAYPVH